MDGMDCIRQLRDWEKEHRPEFRQFVVGISAHAAENDTQKGILAGMDDFVAKPVTMDVLEELELGISKSTMKLNNLETCSVASVAGNQHTSKPTIVSSVDVPITKKQKTDDSSVASSLSSKELELDIPTQKHCLIASSGATDDDHNAVATIMEGRGWTCKRATSSDEAARLLKMRNWDAVLVDERLKPRSGAEAIADFRAWENSNRFNRQNNIFLEFSSVDGGRKAPVASSPEKFYFVQAPFGFDGTISKPLAWEEFSRLVDNRQGGAKSQKLPPMTIITH